MRRSWSFLGPIVLLMSWGWAGAEEKIDLNEANLSQLMSLPGIGPALAERILEYREKNGRFGRIEELLNVRGIGEKKFEKLEERITVAPKRSSSPAPPPKTVSPSRPDREERSARVRRPEHSVAAEGTAGGRLRSAP